MIPDLQGRPADLEGDAALLARLALHSARQSTPTVSVCEGNGLWLDLTGTTHLFGGKERFCRRLLNFIRRLGLTGRIAIANTPEVRLALRCLLYRCPDR